MKTTIRVLGSVALTVALTMGGAASAQDVDFGDDTSAWANDGQCDDPRFEGPGAAAFSVAADQLRDATDCRTAFEAGTVTLVDSGATPATVPPAGQTGASEIDFGADTGNWTNDGECDDGRFSGPGVGLTSPDTYRTDATDCRALYEAGTITYVGEAETPTVNNGSSQSVGIVNGIDYGDNSSMFANDGQCDDPRFSGVGVWSGANESHMYADANDCLAAVQAGEATYNGDGASGAPIGVVNGVDYGDDSSTYANDGQCDDPRFTGPNVWSYASENGIRADASDCLAAVQAGTATYVGEDGANGGNTPGGDVAINFGNDSGIWANDGECDDARFEGPGMGVQSDEHIMADASDCRAAYNAGTISLISQSYGTTYPIVIDDIDFGDDSGVWANDGECDDARFEGAGMGVQSDEHIMADASDCSAAYRSGTVTLVSDGGNGGAEPMINFGNDSSATANDGVCDDPRFQGPGGASLLYAANLMADATDCRAAYNAGTVTFAP